MLEAQRYSPKALADLVARALIANATSPDNAASVARALVAAEMDGEAGHGLSRVPAYAAQARSGKVDGRAVPVLTPTRAASVMIDAAHGFAYPALDLAVAELPAIAARTGIAAAGFVRSHHAGALGLVVERIAAAGMVGTMVSNSPHAMAAWGGRRGLLGTNPIAFAAPVPGRAPIVIDMALSVVARGKIMNAAQKGEPIPQGWAQDADGQPTTDAAKALSGTLAPLGGAKGAALALMVEVMAAALTGANLAFQASSFFDADGPPPAIGQFLIAIDPAAFGGDAAAERIAQLAEAIGAEGTARIPGSLRRARREKAARDGIAVEEALFRHLVELAQTGAD